MSGRGTWRAGANRRAGGRSVGAARCLILGRFLGLGFALCLGLAACSFVGSGAGGGSGVDRGSAGMPTTKSPGGAGPSAEPSGGPSAADPERLAALARAGGIPVTSGAVTLTVGADATVAASAQEDGSIVLTIPVAVTDGPDPSAEPSADPSAEPSAGAVSGAATGAAGIARRVVAVLAAPQGFSFDSARDRSVSVQGDGSATAGAVARAGSADGAGPVLTAELAVREGDAALLDVVVDAGSAGGVSLVFGATPLVSADWGEREGGRSLAVVPAEWVRSGSVAAQDALWSAVIAAEPEADSTTMHDQFTCHALGAPNKDSWNLEPWRPEVNSFTLLATRCNPEP